MAQPTRAQVARARALLARAEARFAGAEAVVCRDTPNGGEFDNNFDGVVSGIFHIVDAFELATTGPGREMREADQATRIASVVTALRAAGITDRPALPGSWASMRAATPPCTGTGWKSSTATNSTPRFARAGVSSRPSGPTSTPVSD